MPPVMMVGSEHDVRDGPVLLLFRGEEDYKPLALGGLEAHPDRIDGHVGIPTDALSPILQMLISGRFKFMPLVARNFRYRSARLHSLRLEMKLTEDDMPPAGLGSADVLNSATVRRSIAASTSLRAAAASR